MAERPGRVGQPAERDRNVIKAKVERSETGQRWAIGQRAVDNDTRTLIVDRCQHCQYYDRNPSDGSGGKSAHAGQCRRHAPSLSPINPKTYMIEGVWPTVRDEDWCGEFKLGGRRVDTQRADALIGSIPNGAPTVVPRVGGLTSAPSSIGSLRAGELGSLRGGDD
jgi:hypothetical protein